MSKRNTKKATSGASAQHAGQSPTPDGEHTASEPEQAVGADLENGTPHGAVGGSSDAVDESASGTSHVDDSGAVAAEPETVDAPSAEVAALKDELLRRQADFENFRKRMNRDKEDAIKFANSTLLMDLTVVIDDFDRAIQSAQESEDVGALRNGLELIEKQLTGMLERKWGLSRFGSVGDAFDPERHEALAQEPSAEHSVTTVVEDYQKGFVLHGRVVRPARVRVATPVEHGDQPPADTAGAPAEGAIDTQGA
jgi:molecular chaperone GrpE